MATDRLSDFKLATGDVLKVIGPARRRAASSCNAFAIATFSSFVEQPTILSGGAEDAHQICTRGSVLGEALNRNSEISPYCDEIWHIDAK